MGNKNISQEPEIKELKRIIVEGELEEGSFLNEGIIHWHASGMNNGYASD